MQEKIAILIPSCDKYSDMWEPFFFCLAKYWPDCPYKIYLLTNNLKPEFENVEVVNVGEDISWQSNLKKALTFVKEENIFLWIDDLFLVQKVDSKRVESMFSIFLQEDLNYLCLQGRPYANKKYNEFFGTLEKGSLYRTSTVMSLWKKSVLLDVLLEEKNAWEFELEGSKRSDKYDKFFVSYQREIKTLNSVIKGKWRNKAVGFLKKEGFILELKRKRFTLIEEFVFNLKMFRTFVFNFIPNKYQGSIRSFFK